MKKLFTLIFTLVSLSLSAQISFQEDSSFAHGSGFEVAAKAQLTNNSDDTTFLIIRKVMSCVYPETAFCDQLLCYPTDQDTAEVVIRKGESFEFKMNFYPYSTEGCCQVKIFVESVKNPTTNVDSCFFQACNKVGMKEVEKEYTRVYPNPAKTTINIESPNKGNFSISIYDILGNEVIRIDEAYNNSPINVKNLPVGIYVLKINGEYRSSTTFRKL